MASLSAALSQAIRGSRSGGDTLLQQTLRRLDGFADLRPPIIVCNEAHRFFAAEQAQRVGCALTTILLEPEGKNTAPAVALAAWCALQEDENAVLLVLPADHVIRDVRVFERAVAAGVSSARDGKLVTFGVVPTRPHTGLGYIKRGQALPGSEGHVVARFVEKPDFESAQRYVDSGDYYWNSGMFLFGAASYLEELRSHAPEIAKVAEHTYAGACIDSDFTRVPAKRFAGCISESIDYAVMEKTTNAAVFPLATQWNDVGDWTAYAELGTQDAAGNVAIGDCVLLDVSNSFIRAESRLIAGIGLDGLLIVDTDDALLVADKNRAQDVRKIVAQLEGAKREEVVAHRQVFRPWGSYEGLVRGDGYQVKRIIVNPGGVLSLQSHTRRAEHWVVSRGEAWVTRGDDEFSLAAGQSTDVPLGVKHRLANRCALPLELIEVQLGSYLGEDDIVRYDDIYGRANTN